MMFPLTIYLKIQPADTVKKALAESFRILLERIAELKYALKSKGDSQEDIEAKINFKRSAEQMEVG